MAMSKPVPSAQLGFITKCDLCDSLEDVNSFCKNCLQNLCDNCKKLHQKIPSLRSHDIGSIGDGRRFHKSEELLCSDHGEILTHCCKTCSMNACPKCLSNHLKHDLLNIDEEGQKMKEELEKTLDSKSKLLEEIRNSRDRILQHKAKFDSVEEGVISKIDGEFEMISKLKTDLKKAVFGRNTKEREKIQEQIDALQTFESSIGEEICRIKEDLPLHSGSSLIKFVRTELEKLKTIDTPSSDTTRLPNVLEVSSDPLSKFVESAKQIAVIMRNGIIHILPEQMFSDDLIILSLFHLKSKIFDIVYDEDDKVWVSCNGEKELIKVDREGKVHERIQMIPKPVYLAKGQNGEVFVTSCNALPKNTNIQKIDSLGNVFEFARLTDFDILHGLSMDNIGFLYCHAKQSMDDFILKIDKKGELEWKTKLGSHKFFTSSITFSPQNTCYIALGSEICVIGSDGNILRRKTWESKVGNLGPILFDKNGFLLAGTDKGAVHILSEDFDMMKTYLSNKLKYSSIEAFDIDSGNKLWIGSGSGLTYVMKYNNV